jgi:hypothetical protein
MHGKVEIVTILVTAYTMVVRDCSVNKKSGNDCDCFMSLVFLVMLMLYLMLHTQTDMTMCSHHTQVTLSLREHLMHKN